MCNEDFSETIKITYINNRMSKCVPISILHTFWQKFEWNLEVFLQIWMMLVRKSVKMCANVCYVFFSKWVIYAELHTNCRFRKDPEKLNDGINVNIRDVIFLMLVSKFKSKPLQLPLNKKTPTSSNYRSWIKKFLINNGDFLDTILIFLVFFQLLWEHYISYDILF